jgi:hypothetical protein
MDDSDYVAIERRLECFILALGTAMTAGAAIRWGIRVAEGAAVGTVLCWANFRWLRHGARMVIGLGLAQAGAEVIHVPKSVRAKFFGCLILLLLGVYATLVWLRLPPVAVLCGLSMVVPAIAVELGYELFHGHHHFNVL